jgi:hypothetical protein
VTGKRSCSRRHAEAISADLAAAKEARMLEEANKPRRTDKWGACFTAAAVATALVGATVARADDDDHWQKRGGTITPRLTTSRCRRWSVTAHIV